MSAFDANLAFGKEGESLIASWLCMRGWAILPIIAPEPDGKGPRLYTPNGKLIVPDMFIMRGQRAAWIEAKRKTVFSWWGKGACWETGIDIRLYEHYLQVAHEYPFDVWLMFLHTSDRTDARDIEKWGAPAVCPTGLFGGSIAHLQKHESHRNDRWGKGGMVYWAHDTLTKIATLDDIRKGIAWARHQKQAIDTLRTITLSPR